MMTKKKTIAVVRGLMPRLTQAEFASSFQSFKPLFITSEADKEILDYLRNKGTDYSNLKLSPLYGFDLIQLVTGKISHRSWVGFDFKELERATTDCDVLETYEAFHFFSGQTADLARKQNKPLVTEIWTSYSHPSTFVPPYSLNVRKVIWTTDFFVLRSKRAHKFLEPFKVPAKKIRVIYHGVNLERFVPSKKNWEGIRILFVGALNEQKGVKELLVGFRRLNSKFPTKLTLVFAGEGPLESDVKEAAGDLPIEFLGFVPHGKLPKVYSQVDIFCAPSKDWRYLGVMRGSEMFGYVLMEAMATGLPIVTTKCGTIPEVVGSKNLVVEQGDADGIYLALKQLVEDRDRRRELGTINRKRAEELFDLRKQTAILEKDILELI